MAKRRAPRWAPHPEIFRSTRATSRAVSAAVAAGRARKLAPRLYTSNMTDAPAAIIRRNLWRVVSLLAPGTVISYRTAIDMAPADDGTVFLTAGYDRRLDSPGSGSASFPARAPSRATRASSSSTGPPGPGRCSRS